jgi:two-component system response regulator FixJ
MTMAPDVHIIDDDDGIRRGLSFLLKSAGIVSHTYGSATEFLKIADDLPQSCIITDVRMPGVSGLELVRRLKANGLSHVVIVITGHGDIALAVEAMKAGAIEFLEKPFDEALLMRAVRGALQSDGLGIDREEAKLRFAETLSLSPRQQDVLRMVVAGKSNKEVARSLGISPRTVETYRAGLMHRVGAQSLSELVRLAVQAGY